MVEGGTGQTKENTGSLQKAPCEINALEKRYLIDYQNTLGPKYWLNLNFCCGRYRCFLSFCEFCCPSGASHHFRGSSHVEMSRIRSERLSGEQTVSPLR